GAAHGAHAARPLRDGRGDRRRGRVPRQRRGRVHHRSGARRRRRPGDDVAPIRHGNPGAPARRERAPALDGRAADRPPFDAKVTAAPPSRPSRPGPGDPSIRRTWWLLAGAFFLLALTNGIRLVTERQPIDWLTVGLVILAAIAAVAHRNAVGGLEARGRGEAESFARILRGLSRSVSAEAIVTAILEDLIDATAADHVVLVRRRPEARALDATLVSRRTGVPPTTTALPLNLLEVPAEPAEVREPVAVPIGPAIEPGEAVDAGDAATADGLEAERDALEAA